MNRLYKFIISILLFFSLGLIENLTSQERYPCIWRNPERTMSRLFPRANDYKTVSIRFSKNQLHFIEQKAGKLLPGQTQVFQYFEMVNANGKLIGYTMASTQKGEYGAIEFVFGLNTKRRINGIYIQRARERDSEFKKKRFLNQFIGKSIADINKLKSWQGIIGRKTVGTSAVISGIIKELVSLDVLVK